MAVGTIGNFAVNSLEFFEFFDPNARLLNKSATEVSLGSRDGYELVLRGEDFAYGAGDAPKDGTITDILLYDRRGDLVGRIDDVSYSLVDYYETVAKDGKPVAFTKDLLSGDDDLAGGAARDRLEGYGGDDKISGGFGADTLYGDGGDDTLNGGVAGDNLYGGSGDDHMFGGAGQDLAFGGGGDDEMFGDFASDRLSGGTGNDSLYGGSEFDTLLGGAGDDYINGGSHGDSVEGGGGVDTVIGGGGDDVLGGNGGDDDIDGGSGKDVLYGDDGDDVLAGGSGDDEISGGAGSDSLVGGAGFDTLFGGGADDTFQFVDQDHGSDVIRDFQRGLDVLSFDASGFDNLTADFALVTGKNPEADTGAGTFLFNTRSHELVWDANGDGKGQQHYVALLEGVNDLDKGDFLIV